MQIQYASTTCFANAINNYEPMTIAWVDMVNSVYNDISLRIVKLWLNYTQ